MNTTDIIKHIESTGTMPSLEQYQLRAFTNELYDNNNQDYVNVLESALSDCLESLADKISDLADTKKELAESYYFQDDGDNAGNYWECFVGELEYSKDSAVDWLRRSLDDDNIVSDELDYLLEQIASGMIASVLKWDSSYWHNDNAIATINTEGEEYHPISEDVYKLLGEYARLSKPLLNCDDVIYKTYDDLLSYCDIVQESCYGMEEVNNLVYMLSRPMQLQLHVDVSELQDSLNDYRDEQSEA